MKHRRSSKSSSRSLIGFSYQDTVTAILQGDGSKVDYTISVQDLLPGLANRQVVLKKIIVEFIPNTPSSSRPETSAQVYYTPPDSNGVAVPSGPFKMLSKVNPTRMVVDITRLARFAPGIQITLGSEDTSTVLTMRLGVAPSTSESYLARVTTLVHVFPQLDVSTVTPG